MAIATDIAATPKPHKIKKPRFSAEIHGVRGLALTMVVAFHLFGQGRVSGGVDVFLVISAYLMTGSLDRAMQRGSFSLIGRYARTFIRLTPAALLTIVATAVVGAVVLPRSTWPDLFGQASAAATFRENVYLATTGMAYGAAGAGASPYQHFWSLSVQAQFFLLWPLAAVAIAGIFRMLRRGWDSRAFIVVAAVMVVVSFAFAIHMVSVDQPVAYYSLPARLWEFGLGALAYFWGRYASRYPTLGGVLGWAGVALIFSSGFVINGRDLFPGPWTLWPVVGTLLILYSADSGGAGKFGLTHTLSLRPIKWLANLGYVLYLWHWPILVLYLVYRGYPHVGWKGATGVLVISVLLSELTNRYVVHPLVKKGNALQKRRHGSVILAASVTAAIALVGGSTAWAANAEGLRQERAIAQALANGGDHPGARVLLDPSLDRVAWDEPPAPAVDAAGSDGTRLDHIGCLPSSRDSHFDVCWDDRRHDAEGTPPRKRVVLAGGSHDTQYHDTLEVLAEEFNWELITVGRNGCRVSAPDTEHDLTDLCMEWNAVAIPEIIAMHPDAIVTLATVTDKDSAERTYQGQIDVWQQFEAAGIPVIGLRDNPRFEERVPECMQVASDPSSCGTTRESVYAGDFAAVVAGAPANVVPIDTSTWFCGDTECPPVIGNVVVYKDYGHFTATYARTLAPLLLEQLEEKAPFLFN